MLSCAAPLPRVVTVAAGDRTRVQVVDLNASGHTFTVQNASSADPKKVYRDTAGETGLKFVEDHSLQQLLDVLAAQGMFANTQATTMSGSRAAIIVEQGDRRMHYASDLHPAVISKLTVDTPYPSPAKARGFALTAIRETFEETGQIGRAHV